MRAPVAAWFLVMLLLTGCTGKPTPPYRPVQVPELPAQPTIAQAKPSSAQPEEESRKPKATEPPTIAAAPPTLLPAGAPALLQQLVEADWSFEAIEPLLPELESSYVDRSGENPWYQTYAYSQGDLRLYVSSSGEVFSLLVGPLSAEYQSFTSLQPGPGYAVHRVDEFVSVGRFTPISADELAVLEAVEWSTEQLAEGLGAETYRYHHHGVGSSTLVWFPQQLAFHGHSSNMELDKRLFESYQTSPGAMAESFARAQVSDRRGIASMLTKGKLSPNQQLRAGIVARGGYWDNWVIVQPTGKAELRFQASYFLLDLLFLDDQSLIYVERNAGLYAIDLTTGKQQHLTQLAGRVTKIGLVEGRRIWYETESKERHELDLP